jgi:disulfide bond formation protein DsbB
MPAATSVAVTGRWYRRVVPAPEAAILETMELFFAILALLANVAVLVLLVLWVGGRFSGTLAGWRDRLDESLYGYEYWFAFVVALVCTLGSLYLSEIEHFEPCRLCWFQRIAMYPLAVILGIAAARRDRWIRPYVLTLASVGIVISIWHYTIQNFPSLESGGSCSVTAPCTADPLWVWGFATIPYMAMSGFALIIGLMLVARANDRAVDSPEVIP